MISTETLAVACGIGSAAAWGAGDFSGGMASRKGNVLKVVLVSQLIGGLFLLGMAVFSGEAMPPVRHLMYGAFAGVFGNIGLIALYRGLSTGRMGIVAPLSAVLTALVPIGYTAVYAGLPSMTRFAGFVCFGIAVWLLSSADTGFRMTGRELLLSCIAGVGFGLFFIFIDKANDLAIFWSLVWARVASVAFLFTVVMVVGKTGTPKAGQWLFIVMSGVLDALGNLLFSTAAHLGRLDVSAVLSSLYPAATVLLAWLFLREKLRRRQWMGVGIAFIALGLISI
ncbi:EamA family transporter [Desulfotignum balticum]|uniref:EamA family transporter n=1 Tax=Desulfotignum balticum TaxID=115781 RepID=UPI00040B545D|nr:EamA family transporter [Desulfotignum balticum]